MYTIIYDRIFWIYFIVTFFFIIIGMTFILSSTVSYMIPISILWLLSNVFLMIIFYHASIRWQPGSYDICVLDSNSECFNPSNRIWLFVHFLFILLLIFAVLWAGELGNTNASLIKSLSGIFILLGGLLLFKFSSVSQFTLPFYISIFYLLIWFILSFYVTVTFT